MTVEELRDMILKEICNGNGSYFIIEYYEPDTLMPIGRFRHVINIANGSLVGGYTNKEVCFAINEKYLPNKFKMNRL